MSAQEPSSQSYTTDAAVVLKAEAEHIGRRTEYGLAMSGGGIRSASFNLGVMQALVSGNVLQRIDYMSTVSGGGYLGSALTWWLHQGLPDGTEAGTNASNFPFGTQGPNSPAQHQILDFIRFHGNYLLPGGYLNTFSLAAVVIRVAIVSLTVYFSWLSLLMLLLFHVIRGLDGAASHLPFSVGSLGADFIVNRIGIAGTPDGRMAKWLIGTSIALCCLFFLGSLLYSIMTLIYQIRQFSRPDLPWPERRYMQRAKMQTVFGRLLLAIVAISALGLLPVVTGLSAPLGGPLTVTVCIALGSLIAFWRGRTEPAERLLSVTGLRQLAGTGLLIYSLAMGSYIFSKTIVDDGVGKNLAILMLVTLSIPLGLLVNVNYLGIHRMYRDRLMEVFLPNDGNVIRNRWGPATDADGTTIEQVCQPPHSRPYHILNCNVVLVDSPRTKYSGRGGDSFIISPLFCGSEATGWCRSSAYMKRNEPGMTLATAMAISGAAANPNTGAAGAGFARNRVVSTLMSLLNLRLGHWAPHPNPAKASRLPPNFIFPGITSGVLVGRLSEGNRVIDLTDGGHFDNLGLYELVRRKLRVIIVCDGSADPKKWCTDLATAIERVRVDFRARIRFDDVNRNLPALQPAATGDPVAASGFAIGTITYDDGSGGVLVYIKATLTRGLAADVSGYHSLHPTFPDEPTSDQFFSEAQFEAYRELGSHIGRQFIEANDDGQGGRGKWI